jgi:general secretion pathway protein G
MRLNNKNSFSILELIFIVVIMGILATVSIPKLLNTKDNASIIRVQNDLNVIQNGLKEYQTKHILQNDDGVLDSLDKDDISLFSNILETPFVASDDINCWTKISNIKYRYNLSSNQNIEFIYDKDDFSFSCDKTLDICKEILR